MVRVLCFWIALVSMAGCASSPKPSEPRRADEAAASGPIVPVAAQQDGGLPRPSGPFAVGTVSFVWTDSSRSELAPRTLFGKEGEKPSVQDASGHRQIEVRLWYAADSGGAPVEFSPYNPDLDAFVRLISDQGAISGQQRLRTSAIPGARVAARANRQPVVLLSPGGGMFASDYTALAQDLASQGYLVAVVAHPGVTLMRRGEGAVSAEWGGWKPPPDLKMDLDPESLRISSEFFARRDSVLAADLMFALTEIEKVDASPGSILGGRIDLDHVAVMGHSTGGAAAAMMAELDSRIGALVVFDTILPRTMFGARIRPPFLLFRTEGVGYPAGWNDLMVAPFSVIENVGFDVVVRGARHQSFCDKPFQRPERFEGPVSAGRVAEIVSLYVRTFLDRYLRSSTGEVPVGVLAPPEVEATARFPSGAGERN